jgi:hypothetical protein
MTLPRISPNNSEVAVGTVVVDDKEYYLPPWLSAQKFISGLTSEKPNNALAALTSLTLVDWRKHPHAYGEGADELVPFFKAEWFVPFDSVQEIFGNVFAPVSDSHYDKKETRTVTVTDTGVIVTQIVIEYFDFNDAQVVLLEEGKLDEYEGHEEDDFDYIVYELAGAFEETIQDAQPGWGDSYFERVTSPDGKTYILFINVHED